MLLRSLLKMTSFLTVAAVAASLSGCSVEMSSLAPAIATQVTPAVVQGKVMGGETPIEGAKVYLYETQNNGYGGAGKPLASATTQVGGGFTFTGATPCDSGQFVYAFSVGGDTANNPSAPQTNNNVVLLAALGSCANFATPSKVVIAINELTTVAAAYALNGFISETGPLGSQLVNISAPGNNNAATGSCTGSGTLMTCTAAGLSHAFANALNLVDSVHYDGTTPTGAAFTTIPANPPGAVTTVAANSLGSVPAALLNSLADIMQYCTNSTGGAAGDGSNCGNFFGDTTPVVGAVPTDTLGAMIEIAQNPRNNVGTTCTGQSGGLFCLLPSTPAFTPALTAVPHDWSVAIVYTGVGNLTSNTTFGVPYYLTLDANDNVYVMTQNLFTPTTGGIAEMTSSGQGLWANPMTNAFCVPGTLATDTNGFVWESVESSSTSACSYAIYGFYTAAGAATYSATAGAQAYEFGPSATGEACGTTPGTTSCPGWVSDPTHAIQSTSNALAFDRLGNLWYGRKSSTCTNCLFELPYTSGSPGTYGAPQNIQNTMVDLNQIMIDPNMNVWVGNVVTSGNGTLYVLPNTSPSTPNTPTYNTNPGYLSATLPSSSDGGIALDASGNVWAGSSDNVSEYTPTTSSGVVTAFGSPANTTTAASKPYPGEVDGGGVYWYGSYTSSGDIYFQLTPASPLYSSSTASHNTNDIQPCYLPAGASTCSSTIASGDPRVLQVDSSGALWDASEQSSSFNQGFVVQVLGIASPTWPQMSYGVFGTKPQ